MNTLLCFLYLGLCEFITADRLSVKMKQLIDDCRDIPELDGNEVEFSAVLWPTDLSASASVPGKIAFSFEWARRILFGNERARQAFLFAVGHELTHKEQGKKTPWKILSVLWNKTLPGMFFMQKKNVREWSFVSWTIEVACDFGGADKMFKDNQTAALNAVYYMVEEKPNNKDSVRYPGWRHRMQYLREGHFDEDLIRQIAEETGCENEELIGLICDYYSDKNVILKNG